MTTEAQINANRANAQKSTGPRTPEGKATVAQNALKHGLLAKEAVVVGEDLDDFELYRAQLRAELAPVGLAESLLVERIAGLFWRLQRAERFHTAAFDMVYLQCSSDPQNKRWQPTPGPDGADPLFGLTVIKDFSKTRVLERLLVYERRIEGSLYRTMTELHKVQGQRQGAGEVPLRDRRPRRSRQKEDYGGPFHRVPETLPPDFTLDNLLAKIAALEEGPQTPKDAFGNPETAAGATSNAPADPSCETKPICEGIGVQDSGISDLTPDPRPLTPALSCETKPISVGPDDNQVPGGEKAEEVGRGRPTYEEPSGGVHTNVPGAHGSSCETKPICTRRIRDTGGYTPVFRRRR